MADCRVLGLEDQAIVPAFVGILQARLKDLAQLDHGTSIVEASQKYTQEYILANLHPRGEKRFVGHFNPSLDGILVEEPDQYQGEDFVVKMAVINWVMAQISGRGIGTELILDSISRARAREDDVVKLSVFTKNIKARTLYERLGFELNQEYDEGRKLLMCYYLNPEMRPR
jgi:GNAT superfamily N-acetyltransferase